LIARHLSGDLRIIEKEKPATPIPPLIDFVYNSAFSARP
jgi:hypothetical protein